MEKGKEQEKHQEAVYNLLDSSCSTFYPVKAMHVVLVPCALTLLLGVVMTAAEHTFYSELKMELQQFYEMLWIINK